MESVTNIEDFVKTTTSTYKPIDWSNGTGYGDGYGNGIACGGIVQNGACCTHMATITDSLKGLKEFEHQPVYHIDDMPVIIYKVLGTVAEGAIIQTDMSIKKCFIARCKDSFAFSDNRDTAEAEAKALSDKQGEDEEDINNN